MEERYGIDTTVEMEGGLQQMCNLSDLIIEKGIEKGKAEGETLLGNLITKLFAAGRASDAELAAKGQ